MGKFEGDLYEVGSVLHSDRVYSNSFAEFFRRLADICISIAVLVFFFPAMLMIAWRIWRADPGPVVFRQYRVGKDGELFKFFKFRTMWLDARERFPELYAYDYTGEEIETLKFKHDDDPRIVPGLARFRQNSLDELPNFLNVIRGEMTLVGPRPDIPEMIQYYTSEQKRKFTVKPGITGYAQINGRGNLDFQRTLFEDISYLDDRSLLTDLKILFRTLVACAFRTGAY